MYVQMTEGVFKLKELKDVREILKSAAASHLFIKSTLDKPLLPSISRFLMTQPIYLKVCWRAFWTFKWEFVNTSVSRGTILGKHNDSCFGAQNDIAPNNSTLPAKLILINTREASWALTNS